MVRALRHKYARRSPIRKPVQISTNRAPADNPLVLVRLRSLAGWPRGDFQKAESVTVLER
jgi:hypothetical protein